MRQDKLVTFSERVIDLIENNRSLVIAGLAAVLGLVLLGVGYAYYKNNQQATASEHLGRIVGVYEAGNFRDALDGVDGKLGLLEIADSYGSTRDGNLARFYVADALYNLGERDEALRYFRSYDKDRNYLGASAIAGEAAIHEDQENFDEAADLYASAAGLFENNLTSPQYLLDAARNYLQGGDYRMARRMYEEIQDSYPNAPVAANLDLYLAQIEALEK